VTRANVIVQDTRVGQRTDFDRLTIQIETDGSIDPGDAVAYAAEIGQAHLQYLTRFRKTENGSGPARGVEQVGRRPVGSELKGLLESPLEAFDGISIRSRNNLDKADIRTLYVVVTRTRDEILNVPSFGEKSLEELAEVVALKGLRFGMRIERDEDGNLWIMEEAEAEESDEA
jgi:DNA-directed RNA polymerase subunit alpha